MVRNETVCTADTAGRAGSTSLEREVVTGLTDDSTNVN